jgi:hypothetical protein
VIVAIEPATRNASGARTPETFTSSPMSAKMPAPTVTPTP